VLGITEYIELFEKESRAVIVIKLLPRNLKSGVLNIGIELKNSFFTAFWIVSSTLTFHAFVNETAIVKPYRIA
jgi:hypothetical protein